MVVMGPKKQSDRRRILPYFMDSILWKDYKFLYTDNLGYWFREDKIRYDRMLYAKNNKKGYTVQEYIYDMIDCVDKAKHLSLRTKEHLVADIYDLEMYHSQLKTLEVEI